MPATPFDRLLELLRAPMRERGFSLRKRAPATFHRDAADDSLRLVLQGRASRGRWHVWVRVRVALLDVERWCRARGLESRGCELQWVVSQDVLRAAMPRPSSLAWANGLDLVDATGDVPSRSELESRGRCARSRCRGGAVREPRRDHSCASGWGLVVDGHEAAGASRTRSRLPATEVLERAAHDHLALAPGARG